MVYGQVQTTAAWAVFPPLFFWAQGKSNRSNAHRSWLNGNAWPEMSLVQADNYGPAPHRPLWVQSRHQQTHRMNGHCLYPFSFFSYFLGGFLSQSGPKKPIPTFVFPQQCVCIFIVYIIDEFADNKSQSNVKKVTGRNVQAMDRPKNPALTLH